MQHVTSVGRSCKSATLWLKVDLWSAGKDSWNLQRRELRNVGTNFAFKEGSELVFWLHRWMQLKQDWKPTWAGTWSQADRLNPLEGRLLSCLSESWHFWVLFVLLVITPCPSMPCCTLPGGVIACGLSVSSFLVHPCFSCACLGLEAHAWGLMLSVYFCTWMLLDDLGSK